MYLGSGFFCKGLGGLREAMGSLSVFMKAALLTIFGRDG